ncbi:unnamed protein product [Nezara viridula]|uniref:RNA-binding protein 48 n=1 Tax=Nezara viridula TaxID=85310 RepID=A0A9P0HS67_NEZVI|nr:unnamed protein product [Nezara viridula]
MSQQVNNIESIEEFTNVYHVHYATLKSSRFAKRNLDSRAFFGGVLHVCYAPELETVEETKNKLVTRRKEVSYHLKQQEFPKQFRNEGKYRGKKRKFEETLTSKPEVLFYNYGQNSNHSNQLPPPDVQLPGPSGVKVEEKITVDVKPFKKLIPAKVSRIIFHNKNKNEIKVNSLI